MNKPNTNQKQIEEKLEEIKKEFIKTIPQLQNIQEVQEIYREVRQKEIGGQYPFINTQAFSDIDP